MWTNLRTRFFDRRRRVRRPPADAFEEVLNELAEGVHKTIRRRRLERVEARLQEGKLATETEIVDSMLETSLVEHQITRATEFLFKDRGKHLEEQYALEDPGYLS